MKLSRLIFGMSLLVNGFCISPSYADIQALPNKALEKGTDTVPTFAELEAVLAKFKANSNTPLRFVFVEKCNGQAVLVDYGYPSSTKIEATYFIKKHNGQYLIDTIILDYFSQGYTNNFAVRNLNHPLTENFSGFAYKLDEAIGKNNDIGVYQGDFEHFPRLSHMAKLGKYQLQYGYFNNQDAQNITPHFFLQAGKKRQLLPKDNRYFVGYDYPNLRTASFIVTNKLTGGGYVGTDIFKFLSIEDFLRNYK